MISFSHWWDYYSRCEFDTDVRIKKYFYHDREQLGLYKKVYIKTKMNVFVIFMLQETKNSNWFDKNCNQENAKCYIKHEESWLRRIVIQQVNYK